MTYTYEEQYEDARSLGYETAKHSTADRLMELVVELSNSSADQRNASFERVMHSQCGVELSDDRIFLGLMSGISELFAELRLTLVEHLRFKRPPGKTWSFK